MAKIGQDVKVMVFRDGRDVDITVCLPVLAGSVRNQDEYVNVVKHFEIKLTDYANWLLYVSGREGKEGKLDKLTLKVNPDCSSGYRRYLLGIGSCVECGEEGLVGRGNSSLGVISTFRPHSMEAPAGKNPVYHTGRVLGYLTQRLAMSHLWTKRIFMDFALK